MSKANPVCPFCKGPISKDLERYGGNCPHCLLEVPGDDAPTDPGLELRNKQKAEEMAAAAKKAKRNRAFMVVGALMVVMLTVLGGWRYQAWKESLEYDPQEYYQLPLEDLTIAEAMAPQNVPVDPVKVPTGTGGTNGSNGSKTPNIADPRFNSNIPSAGKPNNPVASNTPDRRNPTTTGPTGGPSDAVLPDFGTPTSVNVPSASSVGGGDVLSDRKDIEDMAERVIKVYRSQVLACYEQAAKQIPDLKGIWTISFTITPDGTTANIRVKGAGVTNPDMENCMQRRVGSWKFQKLTQEFKLAKQYRLSPSGW